MTRAIELLGKYQRPLALACCAVVGVDIAVDEIDLGAAAHTALLMLAAALGIPQPRAVAQAMADARNPFPEAAPPSEPDKTPTIGFDGGPRP